MAVSRSPILESHLNRHSWGFRQQSRASLCSILHYIATDVNILLRMQELYALFSPCRVPDQRNHGDCKATEINVLCCRLRTISCETKNLHKHDSIRYHNDQPDGQDIQNLIGRSTVGYRVIGMLDTG